jgi:hypothetical protein
MFSFIVASGSTRPSSSIFSRQVSRSSFFAPIFKRLQSIRIDKNNNAIFHESRNRAKGIPNLATGLFSCTSTCGDDDNDDEDNHFRFPPLRGNILVVGDGDFSYSVALAKENQAQGDAKITASSLDTKDFIEETYSKGKENLEILNLDSNVQLKHELDVTENGSCGNERVWDTIVWNFPYPANAGEKVSGKDGSALLAGFFRSMSPILKADGAIFVTLCNKQGENRAWDLKGNAWDSNLAVAKVLSFCASKITGYVPKRAYINEKIPIKDCNTYHICLQRKLFSIMNSELIDSLGVYNENVYCTAKEVCELLKANGGELEGGRFRSRFKETFGRPPFPEGVKLKKALEKLSRSGKFLVDHQGSSFRITKLGKSRIRKSNANTDCTAKEVCELLKANGGELEGGQFRSGFKETFGRPPFPEGVKLKKALEKLSRSGKFLVDHQGSSFSITKLGKSRIRKSIANAECTAEEICELLKENGGKLEGGRFKYRFEEKYGRPPFPEGVKMKKAIEKLSHSGKFQLEMRGIGLWITLPGTK